MIASDECCSEIYFDAAAPLLGGRDAARQLDHGFEPVGDAVEPVQALQRVGHALGLRGPGDAAILKRFLLYRTYHGAALSPVWQHASTAAWGDEAHVRENRALYAQKFGAVRPMLAEVLDVALPDAAFYLCANVASTGLSDTECSRHLYADYNATVLPGSYLVSRARPARHKSRPRFRADRARRRKHRMPRGHPAHRRLMPRPRPLSPLPY